MGEIGPAVVYKTTLTMGDRFRFENSFEFNTMDKYTKAGWYVLNGVDFMVFPSDSGFFLVSGVDYRHRNGGVWSKDGIRIGGGAGYEKANFQSRISVWDKVVSLNDNIQYFPYFEFLVRVDYPFKATKWGLRVESELGSFKYIQNQVKRRAFYSNSFLGIVYKWP